MRVHVRVHVLLARYVSLTLGFPQLCTELANIAIVIGLPLVPFAVVEAETITPLPGQTSRLLGAHGNSQKAEPACMPSLSVGDTTHGHQPIREPNTAPPPPTNKEKVDASPAPHH